MEKEVGQGYGKLLQLYGVHKVIQEARKRELREMVETSEEQLQAMKKLLRANDGRVVLRAVEMVWIALGRLPPKGAHVTLCNHNHLAIGNPRCPPSGLLGREQPFDRADAKAAMALLRQERERQEREKLEMVGQRDRPAD